MVTKLSHALMSAIALALRAGHGQPACYHSAILIPDETHTPAGLPRDDCDSLFATDPAFEVWAEDALDRQLTPITRACRAERVAVARRALAELAKFDRARLDAQQRTSAAVIEWSLNQEVNAEPFADFRFVFNQFSGLHVSLVNFLSQTHPIRNRRDIENYLARLDLVALRWLLSYHAPSLVQHTGRVSTWVGGGFHTARDFVEDGAPG